MSLKEVLFSDTERKYFNKKPAIHFIKIIFGRGYIINNGEIKGYENMEKRKNDREI
jgi:hypothetical protein